MGVSAFSNVGAGLSWCTLNVFSVSVVPWMISMWLRCVVKPVTLEEMFKGK